MTSFVHVDQPTVHPGVQRAEVLFGHLKAARGGSSARPLILLLIVAIVSAVLVVADTIVSHWDEGALLAAWATDAANLAGVGNHDAATLVNMSDRISISGIILCGLIISGLGVLNDVTITQSSAVWELYELAPETTARKLFSSAMRIGRDHIASTVYTIAFAYAGAALPILIIVMLYDRPLLDTLTSAELSEEVVRTLVGSIGLVLAIPVTTLIAVLVVKATGLRRAPSGADSLSGNAAEDDDAGRVRELEGSPTAAEDYASLDTGELAAVVETRRARREAERRAADSR